MKELPPVSIAVVGHTNAGKTSLLRTLMRDTHFGEVSSHPGTTRHVEGGEILIGQKTVLRLYDTPGLEDSIALNRIFQKILAGNDQQKLSALTEFLSQLASYPDFTQEAKVIRQLLQDDLLFYVIDVREPVLGKYKDEIAILNMAAKPVVPVLNFVSSAAEHLQTWRATLQEFGLHALVEFDTVVFRFEDEKRLYEKIQALLAARYEQIQALIEFREQQWLATNQSAYRLVAELLIDVAAYRKDFELAEPESGSAPDRADVNSERLRQEFLEAVRQAEIRCIRALLKLYGFSEQDLISDELAIKDGKWQLDLFDRDNLKNFGLDASSGAIKGAAVGVGIDAAAGGLTLGAAAAIGAAIGAFWSAGKRYKDEIKAKFQGKQYLCIDDVTLQILWGRQGALLSHLGSRGHAAMNKIRLQNEVQRSTHQSNATVSDKVAGRLAESSAATKSAKTKPGSGADLTLPDHWSQWIKLIRVHPEWSALNHANKAPTLSSGPDKSSASYGRLIDEVLQVLKQPD